MHPRVAHLYLEFMLLAPIIAAKRGPLLPTAHFEVPPRLSHATRSTHAYRAMIQHGFRAAPHVQPGTRAFKQRLARGRWMLRQLQDMVALRKYRAMHKRYGWASQKSTAELAEWCGPEMAHMMRMGLANKEVYGYDTMEGNETEEEEEEERKKSHATQETETTEKGGG